MPEDRTTTYEIALTRFIVSDDVERSSPFYTEILGGRLIRSGEPSYVALANCWVTINVGGGPTDDKPSVDARDATSSRTRQQLFPHSGFRYSVCLTRTGALAVPNSSCHRSSTKRRSVAPCATLMAT
jgi:hypothetical protein